MPGFGKEVALVLRLLAVRPLAALLLRPAEKASRRTVQSLFYDKTLVTADRIGHALALSQREAHRRTLVDVARDLGTIAGVRPEWRTALIGALAKSAVPTLVVWSEKDGIIPVAHARAVHAHLPGSTLLVFPSGGHEPHRRHAAAFADAVADFVGAPPPARGRAGPAS